MTQLWIELNRALIGFPRHLSQHPGGFVIARDQIELLVPVENAAMENRSIVQWDKDDLDELHLIKVDILGLGMLSALRRALGYLGTKLGCEVRMQDVPRADVATFDMICAADTVSTFQIESRAQMSMLPRLRPRTCYDLVVEVAIVRPGPIQGGMVYPYLRNRALSDVEIVYPRGAAPGAAAHEGRADLPGAGDADRDDRGRLHPRRGRRPAALYGGLEAQGRPGPLLRSAG